MVQQKQFNLLNTSKNLKMEFIRTPKEIWQSLSKEFKFTVDACASDKNHLVNKYWTKEIDACTQNWNNEIIYCHPMYDGKIPRFIKKACESKCLTVFYYLLQLIQFIFILICGTIKIINLEIIYK